MKRSVVIILVMLLAVVWQADAKKPAGSEISVTGVRFDIKGEDVEIEFALNAGKKAAKRGRMLIITPVLKKDGKSKQLPLVIVEGRASKAIVERHIMAAGIVQNWNGMTLKNGEKSIYKAVFPFEDWMESSYLELEGVNAGCCESRKIELGMIANEVMITRGFNVVYVPIQVPRAAKLSTGDKLAHQFPFIVPVTSESRAIILMNEKEISKKFNAEVVNELTQADDPLIVYFHQGESSIDHSFAGNNESLAKLITAVRAIGESADSRIIRIMIAGYASPEGTAEINDRLGRDRALAAKTFLNEKSHVRADMVTIYNGKEDWPGLRAMIVQSDMPHKQEVLNIIDNTPVWNSATQSGRRGKLMDLRGGDPYRYMFREFFPQLRNAAYIKIYYENIDPIK